MKIEFKNVNKEKLIEKINAIQELLEFDFESMDFTDKNIEVATEIRKKYNKIFSGDWSVETLKIIVADSYGKEIATIK